MTDCRASCALGALICIAVAACAAPGCKSFKEGFDKGFKKSFAQKFGPSCAEAAVKNGAPEAPAKALCDCMGNYLAEHYTPTELGQMTTPSPSTQAMVQAATDACRNPSAGAAK